MDDPKGREIDPPCTNTAIPGRRSIRPLQYRFETSVGIGIAPHLEHRRQLLKIDPRGLGLRVAKQLHHPWRSQAGDQCYNNKNPQRFEQDESRFRPIFSLPT